MGYIRAKTSHRANDTFASYSGGLDASAVFHDRLQRKHPAMWEKYVFRFFASFRQNTSLLQLLHDHVGREQSELVVRQRRQ